MDKSIMRLIISVFVTLFLVIISVPLWENTNKKNESMLAESYGNLSITVNMGNFPDLVVIEDDRALELLDTTPISFRNPNSKAKRFSIYYLYDKSSTIDYKDIVIYFNYEIYHLSDIVPYEEEDNYYFRLMDTSLGGYSDKTYYASIWLDEETPLTDEEMILITNFVVR